MQTRKSENNVKPYRVAIYARKSSDDRKGAEKSLSVEDQTNDCVDHIFREGWELVKDGDAKAFADDGITGRAWPEGDDYTVRADADKVTNEVLKNRPKKQQRRPGFGRLCDAIREDRVDIVVVRDMARLARPVFRSDFQNFIPNFFTEHKVHVHSLRDGRVDYTDFHRGIAQMMNEAMVDYELRLRASQARKAYSLKQSKGYYMPSRSLYGLKMVGEKSDQKLVPDENAVHVKDIFARIRKGEPLTRIAREYNKMGLKTPAQLEKKKRKKPAGKVWETSGIRHIATNPIYAGLVRSENGLIKCLQVKSPLIPAGLYHTAVDILSKRDARPRKNATSGGLASGVIYCGECDHRLFNSTGPGGKKRHRCNNESTKGCRTSIRTENLDAFLSALWPLKPIVEAEKRKEHEAEQAQLPKLEKEEKKLKEQVDRLAAALVNRKDLDEALKVLERTRDDLKDIRRKIAMIRELPVAEKHYLSAMIDKEAELDEEGGIIRLTKKEVDEDAKRQFIKDVFPEIVVHREKVVFNLAGGDSFTVKRTEKHRWLPIPELEERVQIGDASGDWQPLPLTGLVYQIDRSAIVQPVAVLGGKLIINPSGKSPEPEKVKAKMGRPKGSKNKAVKPKKVRKPRAYKASVDF